MSTRNKYLAILLFIYAAKASAVSVNIGWHNPPNANLGLNVAWIGTQWGFEVGVGQVEAAASDEGSALRLAGGLNGKYFFSNKGSLRVYGQLGLGMGIAGAVGEDSGLGAGLGGLYGGVGLLAGSESLYFYLSGNANGASHFFPQVGIGFGI